MFDSDQSVNLLSNNFTRDPRNNNSRAPPILSVRLGDLLMPWWDVETHLQTPQVQKPKKLCGWEAATTMRPRRAHPVAAAAAAAPVPPLAPG